MLWALSILGLLVLLAVASRLKAIRAENQFPPRGQFSAKGIHYEVKGNGPVVVLVHGSDGCMQDFDPLSRELQSSYKVIAYDRPGHGYSNTSELRPWTVSAQIESLLGLLNELGIEKATIVGHSWGAAVALGFSERYPKRTEGVVTLAGWMYAGRLATPLLTIPLIPGLGQIIAATLLIPLKPLLVFSSLREAFHPHPVDKEYKKLANALWQRYAWQTVHFAHENSTAIADLKRISRLYNRVQAPIEAIFGSEDRAVDARFHSRTLLKTVQQANGTEIELAGHELHRFHQEIVSTAINRAQNREPIADTRLETALKSHGACPVCWQSTNRGMELLYKKDSVAAGVTCGACWVAAGEPIAASPAIAAQEYDGVCWFGVSEQYKDKICEDGSHSAILIGSQPIWDPTNWNQKLLKHASLRSQIKRATNKGVTITQTDSPIGLKDCQSEWLGRLAVAPFKFLTEPVDFENADGRQFFVATQSGRVVGYLVSCPIPAMQGRLVEEIARRPDAPNGTTESLIAHAMSVFAKENAKTVTLGLAPLSNHGVTENKPAKGCAGLALKWMRAHGKRFYNFEGIEAFKAKMQPDEWLPVYSVVRGEWKLRHIGAIIEAFTGDKPIKAATRFACTAIAQELRWIIDKRKR